MTAFNVKDNLSDYSAQLEQVEHYLTCYKAAMLKKDFYQVQQALSGLAIWQANLAIATGVHIQKEAQMTKVFWPQGKPDGDGDADAYYISLNKG